MVRTLRFQCRGNSRKRLLLQCNCFENQKRFNAAGFDVPTFCLEARVGAVRSLGPPLANL